MYREFLAGLNRWVNEAGIDRDQSSRRRHAADKIIQAFRTNQASLELEGLGLTSLPPELGYLTNLEKLNLRSNALERLPTTVENLTNIRWLRMDSNKFSSMPPTLCLLKNLQYLDMSWNGLTSIHEGIVLLKNLQTLSLEHNALTQIHKEFDELASLQELNLSWNEITKFSATLGNLPYLEYLNLRHNPLLSVPATLRNKNNLQLRWDLQELTNADATIGNPEINPSYYSGPIPGNGRDLQIRASTSNAGIHGSIQPWDTIEEMEKQLNDLDLQDPDGTQRLRNQFGQLIRTQKQNERIDRIHTQFSQWSDHGQSVQDQAKARYYHNAKLAARSLLNGSIVLNPVDGRPVVSNDTGWNAISKIAHCAASGGAKVAGYIPIVGEYAKTGLEIGDAMLGIYSTYKFNSINKAVSKVLEEYEVESFCDAFARGAALMIAPELLGRRQRHQRYFIDRLAYGVARSNGTAAADMQETVEESLANGHTARAIIDLAFLTEPQRLQKMTTAQKVEEALRYHFCDTQGIPFNPDFVVCPSPHEQPDFSGFMGATVDTRRVALDARERTTQLEQTIAKRDARQQKHDAASRKLKKAVHQVNPNYELSDSERSSVESSSVSLPAIKIASALSESYESLPRTPSSSSSLSLYPNPASFSSQGFKSTTFQAEVPYGSSPIGRRTSISENAMTPPIQWDWSDRYQFFYKDKTSLTQQFLEDYLDLPDGITSWKKVTPIPQAVGTSSSENPFWIAYDRDRWETNTHISETTLDALAGQTYARSDGSSIQRSRFNRTA